MRTKNSERITKSLLLASGEDVACHLGNRDAGERGNDGGIAPLPFQKGPTRGGGTFS